MTGQETQQAGDDRRFEAWLKKNPDATEDQKLLNWELSHSTTGDTPGPIRLIRARRVPGIEPIDESASLPRRKPSLRIGPEGSTRFPDIKKAE